MNKNLPQTIKIIRELLGGTGDIAQAIGHALDKAGLVVDPERTYGTVLRRTEQGWAPVTPPAPDTTAPTDLEAQARAWDSACGVARELASSMATQYAAEPDVTGVTADGDTVVVSLHITDPARWAGWLQSFGLAESQLIRLDYAVCGRTSWGGVPLSVLAYDVPELQAAEVARARRPYRYGGVVYDLALPHRDTNGDTWFFQGETSEGMPLLSIDGRPERCSLSNVVEFSGPLSPVRELLTVAAPGGERA
ncbi:BN159_2729 family protein [Streptomyces sp. NPDC056707]|uniref:BN159_2729 family protein n=1 Tax=Streptomyces sp. NPDC056707 TaxID=3345919 RepID=UPI00369C6533